MASGKKNQEGKVITLEALMGEDQMPEVEPTLILRSRSSSRHNLHQESGYRHKTGGTVTNLITTTIYIKDDIKACFSQLFHPVDDGVYYGGHEEEAESVELLELNEAADPEVTRRNQERLKKIVDSLKENLNHRLDLEFQASCTAMEGMSPEQQEDLLTFWDGLKKVFTAFLDWIGRMLNNLVKMVQAGWKLVKKTVKQLFQVIVDWFQQLRTSNDD